MTKHEFFIHIITNEPFEHQQYTDVTELVQHLINFNYLSNEVKKVYIKESVIQYKFDVLNNFRMKYIHSGAIQEFGLEESKNFYCSNSILKIGKLKNIKIWD